MEKNYFDPHTSFIRLPIFKATILISITLATIASAIIIANSELRSNLSFEGFNQALTIFKLPLGILAVTIPIIALLAANHKSEQTREQMRLASENNNFSNYFKHFSEFQSYLENHQSDSKLQLKSVRNFHKLSFPAAKQGNYRACEKLRTEIIDIISKAKTRSEEIKEYRDNLRDIASSFEETKKPIKEELETLSEILRKAKVELRETESKAGNHESDNHKRLNDLKTKITTAAKRISEIDNSSIELKKDQEDKENPLKHKIQEIEEELIEATNSIASKLGITYNEENVQNIIKIPVPSTSHHIQEIISSISTIAKAINISFEFDENYHPPAEIDLFIKHFNNTERLVAYSFWGAQQKYINDMESKK